MVYRKRERQRGKIPFCPEQAALERSVKARLACIVPRRTFSYPSFSHSSCSRISTSRSWSFAIAVAASARVCGVTKLAGASTNSLARSTPELIDMPSGTPLTSSKDRRAISGNSLCSKKHGVTLSARLCWMRIVGPTYIRFGLRFIFRSFFESCVRVGSKNSAFGDTDCLIFAHCVDVDTYLRHALHSLQIGQAFADKQSRHEQTRPGRSVAYLS